jgi:colanic acid/amylovoran biosynthesis protein
MNKLNEPQILLFGAGPDTGNQGVTALCYSVVDGLAKRKLRRICVFDHGRGRHASQILLDNQIRYFDRLGAINGRRYYRSENLWQIRLAARFGGLWNENARTICRASAVLDVSGGDSFTEIYGPQRFKTITLPKLIALRAGKPLILLPQTYGPFHSNQARAIASEIIRRSSAAWARDKQSFEQLKLLLGNSFNPMIHRLGVDMAFGLPTSTAQKKMTGVAKTWICKNQRDLPVIGFNVSGLLYNDSSGARARFGLHDDYRKAIINALGKLVARTNARILLIPHVVAGKGNPECDLAACFSVVSDLDCSADRVCVLEGDYDAAELKWIISRTDWFCGTRMHATIAALSSEIPTMALAYSMKTRGVFDCCDQGSEVIDLRYVDGNELADQIYDSWRRRAQTRVSLLEALPEVISQAKQQMDDIAVVIRRILSQSDVNKYVY